MKVLRIIGNIIIGLLLFVFIFSLTFISRTKDLVENDVLYQTIKASLDESANDDKSLKESQDKLIDDMFGDSEAGGVIRMVLDNYREYKECDDKNQEYKVSKDDAKRLYDFIFKYKKNIEKISGTEVKNMSDKEFEEFFTYEKINEFANDSFKEFDKHITEDSIKFALDAYIFVTSKTVKYLLIGLIIVFIALLMLINWSYIKWMIITGIDLMISGSLIGLVFIVGNAANIVIKSGDIDIQFNFIGFLIAGIIEFILGIILIVLYSIFYRKLLNSSKTVEENKVISKNMKKSEE